MRHKESLQAEASPPIGNFAGECEAVGICALAIALIPTALFKE